MMIESIINIFNFLFDCVIFPLSIFVIVFIYLTIKAKPNKKMIYIMPILMLIRGIFARLDYIKKYGMLEKSDNIKLIILYLITTIIVYAMVVGIDKIISKFKGGK